ncbi:His Kinase A (phospho-acceptor) domain-containing protein [Desulfuromusa kysingii]|uniref:histidine kinase n=1 Tax=Desulfuromusa kysingii TaxID=37625 RepID=A0A1H3XLQ2_9BACT|nr:HAMP domain-containing sensor histidine kinase [Desulfuromusa kysingii]SEA00385.1 His Kinase A (phospho-acceptor) domain-containing protein [Desulfuromusa kysingii]
MAWDTARQLDDNYKNTWGFAQLLEHIEIGILVLDLKEHAIDYCNAAFFEVLQNDKLCSDYQGLYDLFVRNIEALDDFDLAGRAAHQVTYQGRLFGHSVYKAASDCRCVFIRDITEKSRLEAIAQAANAMDNIGFIFSGIRHEIGNPLNSLKMALSVLKQNSETTSPQILREYLDRGLADIGRMEYLLKSLKAFTMYDSVELKDLHLVEFMGKFISLIERDFNSYGIRIKTEIPLDLAWVRIDERALHQSLLNIFNNAADALREQEVPEIHIRAEVRDQLMWLTIADNGSGIYPEQLKHLFQPFNTNKVNGNGLGLVITRKLLAMMDSDIDIVSEPGCGTQVTIRLPIVTEEVRALQLQRNL